MTKNNNTDIQIDEPVMLININKAYKDTLTEDQLYDATRDAWNVSLERARKAKYALSNYGGEVKEVYEIDDWEFAGLGDSGRKRYRFYGRIAPDEIRNKYLGESISGYRKLGSQNPINYVNC